MASRTILFLASNPKGTERLRLDEEVRDIDESLKRSKLRDQFNLKQKWAVRVDDLQRGLLDEQPAIVHFSGHGTPHDGVIVEDETGKAEKVNPRALAGLFELFADQIECVVLNACYSEDQADAISKHIKYVVGMKTAVGDEAAIKFAVGFYGALGAGKSYDVAFKLGCNAIGMSNIPEDLTPQLKVSAAPPPRKGGEVTPTPPQPRPKWQTILASLIVIGVMVAVAGLGINRKIYWDRQEAAFNDASAKNELLAWDEYLNLPHDAEYDGRAEDKKAPLIELKRKEAQKAYDKAREIGTAEEWSAFQADFQKYETYMPDKLKFAELMIKDCKGVDFSKPLYNNGLAFGPDAARWCIEGGEGTIKALRSKGSCSDYVEEFGNMHQKVLGRRAIREAKDRLNAKAIADINACLCYDPDVQQKMQAETQKMICWLRTQPQGLSD